jgi:HEAT repeat protein
MSEGNSPAPDSMPLRPEELPPVTPPSSGYIIQLFLIPALIVAAVVAVWTLFGMLANSGTDWQQLVADLGSGNEHRRGRAEYGLAQLLRNEDISPPTEGLPLAEQPEVVDALTTLLDDALSSVAQAREDIRHQAFLARTVGSLSDDDKTLPVLARAMRPESDTDVRQSALMAVAIIAGRKLEKRTRYASGRHGRAPDDEPMPEQFDAPTITNDAVWTELKRAAQDQEPVVRHLAAFAIGNVGGAAARDELEILLLDGDPKTRANAALGLTRNGSTVGIPTMMTLLNDALKPWDERSVRQLDEARRVDALAFHDIEQPQIVRNCLRAFDDLRDVMDDDQKTAARGLIKRLNDSYHTPDVRSQAGSLLKEFR